MPIAVIWLVAALALAGAEVLTGDLFLLMLAGGALAAAGTSAVLDWPIWADGLVFAVVSVLLLATVRPSLRRRMESEPWPQTGIEALEGASALVLEQVSRSGGRVKLDGEIWSARPLNEYEIYEPGRHVTVISIDGATAVVGSTR
ncbi:NfeD family protein [Mycolicibacterium brumae]|uniref:NfeD family protein n=1 Tax=Mycolicibacterium brumae TaxID=85968 RepID=A0A2G5P9R9_9MYCO|nr:NfeD family protein [Mycolicibacterium brumae]MCV7193697.1 NfeD family protein [Mycolicibacterium brumae]PIB75085.1 NfeD family protein [Mycolicibacterium brumae]RWA17397.1 hypothetical protein MBRU_07145 [Mycolicibacterium brumae DSM 44177]UWW09030.1 NfeD family protein [Mycolicibacterium brumae]